jgi:HK97 family phage portal protein
MGTIYQSLRRWFGAIGATGQQAGIQYGEPFARIGSTPESAKDYGMDGAMQLSAVWSAVELLVDNIASLPLFVYNRSTQEEGHKTLARDAYLFRLLHDEPNRRMTPMEFYQFLTFNFLLRGNAYARLIRGANGEVLEMWPLATDQVEVEVLRDRSVVYKYYYEGTIVVYAADSILHWKDKGNGIVGMDRLSYMRQSVALAVDAHNHTNNVYRKSAKRPGVFMIDKLLTQKQRDEIRANYKGLVEGSEDDLLVLEAGAKFEPLNMTPADLQLLDTRRFSIEEIARWFGIPGVLINDTTKATTWGSGIEQIIQGFYKFRLRPMIALLEQAIEARVLTAAQRKRYTVEFSLDALLRGSLKERLEIGARAVQNGLMTRNEWRQLENLPPMEGGDVLTAQSNLLPITKLGDNSTRAQGGASTDGEAPDASKDTIAQ